VRNGIALKKVLPLHILKIIKIRLIDKSHFFHSIFNTIFYYGIHILKLLVNILIIAFKNKI